MKMVKFTRDMHPHVAGERRVVPDEVAARLIAAGEAEAATSLFDHQPAPEKAAPRLLPITMRARKER
jgi:hypothetical protein